MEEYDIEFECENCKNKLWFKIPKGTTVGANLKNVKCENCGCYLLQKWNKKKKQRVNE